VAHQNPPGRRGDRQIGVRPNCLGSSDHRVSHDAVFFSSDITL